MRPIEHPLNAPKSVFQRAVRHSTVIVLLVALVGVVMWGALRAIERGQVERLITQYEQEHSQEIAEKLTSAVLRGSASEEQRARIEAMMVAQSEPNAVR